MTLRIAGHPVASRPDDDSVVILGADRQYYSLSGPGRLVWDALSEGPCTAHDLVTRVVDDFDVGQGQATEDLEALLEELKVAGLVEESPQ